MSIYRAVLVGLAMALTTGVANAERLTIAIPPTFMPFMFQEDGEWTGFEVELWEAIAEKNDWEYEYETMDFSGILSALQTGRVDGTISSISITSDRLEVFDYSHAYYDTGLMLMVSADNDEIQSAEDIEGKSLAVTTGTTSDDFAPNLEPAEISRFSRAEEAYLEVRTGRADAALHDTPNVLYYVENAGEGEVKAVGENMQAQSVAMAFPRGSDIRKDVNIALLELMEDGEYAEIYRRWFGEDPSPR